MLFLRSLHVHHIYIMSVQLLHKWWVMTQIDVAASLFLGGGRLDLCCNFKLLFQQTLLCTVTIGESWGMANTFLLGLINATYMHDLKSLVYNHKEQVKYY